MPRPEPGSVNVLARSADDSRPAAVKARAPLRPLDSGPVLVLFENDRVRVADFRLPPGGSFHTSHEYATVRWQVEEGQHALNGASCESVRDKQVFFLEPGESWEIRNTGDTVYRQITFELKRPPRRTEAEVAALLRSAIYSTDVGTELLLENRWCRVWDFSFLPGGGAHDLFGAGPLSSSTPRGPVTRLGADEDVHHHVLDYVFVFAYPGRLLLSNHDGSPRLADSINGENDVTWNEIPDGAASIPTFAHGGRNGLDDRPMREYLVELK